MKMMTMMIDKKINMKEAGPNWPAFFYILFTG